MEMKGADGERAISKGNIITFSYLLLEHSGGGKKRRGGEARGWRLRGAFKSNNPSPRYTRFSCSHSPPTPPSSLFTFHPNLSISLYISPPFSISRPPRTHIPSLLSTGPLHIIHPPTAPHPLLFNVKKMTMAAAALLQK